jgi:hypothetical protein
MIPGAPALKVGVPNGMSANFKPEGPVIVALAGKTPSPSNNMQTIAS